MAEAPQDNMADFFDFASISVPEHIPEVPEMQLDDSEFLADLSGTEPQQPLVCPSHPGEDCLCHGLVNEFGIDQTQPAPILQVAENYDNFAVWIPRYSKPEQACEYCRSRHLECWFTYEGQKSCSPCNALFRACSFSTQEARPRAVMDTLHVVQEDQMMEQGTLTGLVALKSFDRSALEPQDDDDDRPSRKTGARFPRAAVKILKDWMDQHRDHPYPTEEEKEELKTRTGLKSSQISNWLANTRRRTKTRARGVSPSIRSPTWPTTTKAIDIPFDKQGIRHNGKTWDIMNPLERWQHSPPENEPASVSDIANALTNTRTGSHGSSLSSSVGARNGIESSAASSSFGAHRAPSLTSLETGQSDSLLSSGSLSNLSLGSSMSHGSRNSLGSGRGKDRRRRRRTAANPSRNAKVAELRPFQCTFCTDRFRTKYDWSRHEKSLHLSLEKWICAPIGPVVAISSSGKRQCVYCSEENPTDEHIETHNHRACEEKGMDSRTFYRKDHLRQHLRLVHGCKMIDSMDSWKSEATFIRSRCGFCKQDFTRWQDRVDHLSKHFRAGAQMKDWKGCRGLDPAVAAQVTNAMPPYLIGNESMSPFPFSASNEATWSQNLRFTTAGADLEYAMPALPTSPNWADLIGTDQTAVSTMPDFSQAAMMATTHAMCMPATTMAEPASQTLDYSRNHSPTNNSLSPGAITCWEILTVRLGQYVKEQMQAGILPSDEALQQQARQILYEDDDSWNQTAADNQEWLELFKKAHGLPSTATDLRVDLDEDLGARLDNLNFDGFFQDNAWDLLPDNAMVTGV